MISFISIEYFVKRNSWLPGCCMILFISNFGFSQEAGTVEKPKHFDIHGNIGLNLVGYGVWGIPSRASPFSAVISANITAKFYNIELPISIVIANKQKGYAQSFDQIGISPHWKWITLHGGYRNITFSNYTLAGHTFLGGGIELTPGLFRFGFIYGQFDRKTTGSNASTTDALPHFARRGFAVKLGVGNEKNYFDLLFLRIRDDSTSLQQADTAAITTPEQNVVAGINSHFTFAKKLTWDLEGAVSLYTTNLGAQQINDIEEDKTLSSLNKFLSVNFSSEYYYAVRSALHYKEKTWSLKLEFKRIEPRYRSMGAYFFNNDVENLTLSPSFALFKRKLTVSGGIGFQRDNLRNTKRATSSRTIGNVSISCNPNPKYGFTVNYGNYSISQRAGNVPLKDSTKVDQATHNFSFTPRLFLIKPGKSHMLLLVYNLAACRDKNEFTNEFTRFTSQIAQLNYILSLTDSKWSVNTGLILTLISNYLNDITGIGGTAGVSKTLLKDKLMMNWSNGLTRNYNGQSEAWVFNSSLSSTYKPGKHHSLRLYLYFTGRYTGSDSVNPSFNELKGDLSYVYTF
jgi:hypothetical protein